MKARERILGAHDLDHNFGPHDSAELHALEDEAIREAVALRESVGLNSITDGEFRRRIWWSEFLLSLDGVNGNYRGATDGLRDETGHTVPTTRIEVTDRLRWRYSVNVDPFQSSNQLRGARQKLRFRRRRRCSQGRLYPSASAADPRHSRLLRAYEGFRAVRGWDGSRDGGDGA